MTIYTPLVTSFCYIIYKCVPYTELLLFTFKRDPYLQFLLHWALRRHGLMLLNSLLVHCFHPGDGQGGGRQPQGNTSADHKALVTNMTRLLDGTADDNKAR